MIKLLKNMRPADWVAMLISTGFIVLQVWLDLLMPDYMKTITELVQTGGTIGDIMIQGAYMLSCALGSALTAVVTGFIVSRVAAGFSARLREKIFTRVSDFSANEVNKFSMPGLITRTTNDVTQVQTIIAMGVQVMIKAPILAVWAIVKILGKSWQWSALTGIAVAVLIVTITFLVLVAMPKFKIMQKLTDNLNRVSRENLTGIRVVKAFNSSEYQEQKFDKANEDITKTSLFANRSMAVMMPMMTLIMNGLSVGIYLIGAYLISAAAGGMAKLDIFSDMIVFSSHAMQVIMAFMMLTMVFVLLPRASVSAKRICEVLETPLSITNGEKTEGSEVGTVEFKDVSFAYSDGAKPCLEHISFKAKKGDTVAFIGATASGKSTLVNLIPRLYDATDGEVLVDGVNVKEYDERALRKKIGFAPQRAVLFSGTVESNVTFGDNNTDFTQEALNIAQATEFVDKMENKQQAEIAQGGRNVSGGQKQRLCIARTIARKPEIYIFDDSFSALDYKTDRQLRGELKAQTEGVTTLIVAQRIGTIMDSDKIIVLDSGKIVGEGTHKELMENCDIYREIAYSQLSKEELA